MQATEMDSCNFHKGRKHQKDFGKTWTGYHTTGPGYDSSTTTVLLEGGRFENSLHFYSLIVRELCSRAIC